MALKFRKPSPDCATGGAPSSEAKSKREIKIQKVQVTAHLLQFNCTNIMDQFTKMSLDVNEGKKTFKC
jgi:hypothetical protein